MYEIEFTSEANMGLELYKKSGNTAQLKKISKLVKELREHPKTGTGKPEKLKHKYSGYWSRRIDSKNRIMYRIEEERITVLIFSVRGHYIN